MDESTSGRLTRWAALHRWSPGDPRQPSGGPWYPCAAFTSPISMSRACMSVSWSFACAGGSTHVSEAAGRAWPEARAPETRAKRCESCFSERTAYRGESGESGARRMADSRGPGHLRRDPACRRQRWRRTVRAVERQRTPGRAGDDLSTLRPSSACPPLPRHAADSVAGRRLTNWPGRTFPHEVRPTWSRGASR